MSFATAIEGETYTRVRFSWQLVHDLPNSAIGAWSIIGSMGVIESGSGASAPPGRPLSDPGLDWLWIEPVLWRPAITSYSSTGAIITNLEEASADKIDVRAQRMANPGGSKLWAVWQWSPTLVAGASMRRRAWFSVGILEPA